MKRTLSILLFVVITLSLFITPVYAQENSKIESNLLSVLETMEDEETLQVWVFIYDVVNEAEVVQKTFEQCGLTKESAKTKEEVDLYLSTYRNIKADMYEAHNKEVFEKFGIPEEDLIFFSTLTPSFIFKASKAKVLEIALIDEVASIGAYKLPIKPDPQHLYEKRFIEIYENVIFSESHEYDELYYHYDENGEIDWALIYECSYNAPPWEYHSIFRGRIFMYGTNNPFSFGYGMYDVKEDKFYDIISEDFDFSKYDDFEEVYESFNFGYPIGDADQDHILSVLDATMIQRVLAGLDFFDSNDYIGFYNGYESRDEQEKFPNYISDFDCDGERTIMDATAIQKALAQNK